MSSEWLEEQLKTTRNLCTIALLLIQAERQDVLPTILEYLFEEAQKIVDEHCVVK